MARMTIMVGLPASGKSTKAEELTRLQGNTVRINKDLIRKMLHFDKFTGRNEGLTKEAARVLAKEFLGKDINVIIDDTNLNERTVQSWKDLAKEVKAKIHYEKMDTTLEECLKRDAAREDRVGEHVILGMAMQNRLYPKPEQGVVICDIDGTLADASHRVHLVQGEKKDWNKFFALMMSDTPRLDVISRLLELEGAGHEIFLVSGRPDNYRAFTEDWLENKAFNGYKPYKTIFMRPEKDSRSDDIVKKEIYEKYFKDKYPVHLVIDDRPSVIRMWSAQGLSVEDVGNGVEF